MQWGIDSALLPNVDKEITQIPHYSSPSSTREAQDEGILRHVSDSITRAPPSAPYDSRVEIDATVLVVAPTKSLSLIAVIVQLSKSSRALVALFITLTYG